MVQDVKQNGTNKNTFDI